MPLLEDDSKKLVSIQSAHAVSWRSPRDPVPVSWIKGGFQICSCTRKYLPMWPFQLLIIYRPVEDLWPDMAWSEVKETLTFKLWSCCCDWHEQLSTQISTLQSAFNVYTGIAWLTSHSTWIYMIYDIWYIYILGGIYCLHNVVFKLILTSMSWKGKDSMPRTRCHSCEFNNIVWRAF